MKLQISKYCIIANQQVIVDGKTVYTGDNRDNFKEFAIEAYKQNYITYPKFFKMDNLSKLGFLASELIMRGTTGSNTPKPGMGVVLMNKSSSLDTDRSYQKTIQPGENYFPSPSVFVYTLPNIAIGEICIRHKIQGENIFFINEEFDARLLHSYTGQLFATTSTQACLCGWLEMKNQNYFAFLMLVEGQKDADKTIFEVNTISNIFNKIINRG